MAPNYGVDCRNISLTEEETPTLQARCSNSINGGGVSSWNTPKTMWSVGSCR